MGSNLCYVEIGEDTGRTPGRCSDIPRPYKAEMGAGEEGTFQMDAVGRESGPQVYRYRRGRETRSALRWCKLYLQAPVTLLSQPWRPNHDEFRF